MPAHGGHFHGEGPCAAAEAARARRLRAARTAQASGVACFLLAELGDDLQGAGHALGVFAVDVVLAGHAERGYALDAVVLHQLVGAAQVGIHGKGLVGLCKVRALQLGLLGRPGQHGSVGKELLALLVHRGELVAAALQGTALFGEHLLLLNNDIEVLSHDFLRELLSYSQRPDVGAVGAKLYYPDDTIQHAGVIMGINGSAGHSHKSYPRTAVGDMYRLVTTQNYMAVTGACLMTKASLYRAFGGLDEEKFAVAYNDVDYCLKLWQKGLLNVYTPRAEAYHYESKSRGLDTLSENAKRYEREKANFYAKYQQYIDNYDPYYNPHFNNLFENFGLK